MFVQLISILSFDFFLLRRLVTNIKHIQYINIPMVQKSTRMKSAAYLTNHNSANVAITPLPWLYKHGISLGCLLSITADLTPQWQRRRVHLGLDTLQCLSMHLRGIIPSNNWKSRANLLKGINLLALFFCFALLHKLLCCFVLVL